MHLSGRPDASARRPGASHLLRLALPLAFLALFFAYPLARTLGAAFSGTDAWQWAADDYVRSRLVLAAVQALLSVLLTMAIAVPLAWHHHARALPFSRLHLAVHGAPFVLPVFVVVHGMRELFGTGGWTDTLLGADVLATIGPLGAVILAHAYYNYGFAARLIHAALERRTHRLEEAARVLGAPPRTAFLLTTARLLLPSLAAVALLVFLFCFTSFGVVLLLGGGDVSTLETLLYQQLGGVFPREDRAAVLGVIQLVLNVLVLLGYFALRRREARPQREARRPPATARRRDHLLSWGVLVLGLAPAMSVLIGGFRVRGDWTLEAWRALLDPAHPAHVAGFDLGAALVRSILYAAGALVLSVALALALAYALQAAGRLRRAAEVMAALPLGTSSVLIGFGYILAFGAGSWLDLRGSVLAIVIVHSLIAFPFVARIVLPALDEHDRRLDEAARLLGAPPAAVVRRIHLPLLRGPLVAACGFAVAMSLGDFGASLLLMRQETLSIAVWIARHDRPFELLVQAQGVALSAILMVMAAVAYMAVEAAVRPGRPR